MTEWLRGRRRAPITVRLGAIGVLLFAAADAVNHIRWLHPMPADASLLWAGVARTVFSLSLGALLAWGIASMHGLFYVLWFALTILMSGVELGLALWRLVSTSPTISSIKSGGELLVMGLLWLVTSALLLAPASVRAFWSRDQARDVG